jgi:hypothetical protein
MPLVYEYLGSTADIVVEKQTTNISDKKTAMSLLTVMHIFIPPIYTTPYINS